jgi:hypothetical protein
VLAELGASDPSTSQLDFGEAMWHMAPQEVPMRCLFRVVVLSAVLAPLCLSLGCSRRESATPARSGQADAASRPVDLTSRPGTRFKVTYSDRTVPVTQTAFRRALKRASSDRRVLVFDKAAEPFASLKPGSILFIKKLAFLKVVAVLTEGADVYVAVTSAALPDVIRNGDIHWQVPVNFGEFHRTRRAAERQRGGVDWFANWRSRLTPNLIATLRADSRVEDGAEGGKEEPQDEGEGAEEGNWEFKGLHSGGWSYAVQYTPQPDRLNFAVQLRREKETTEATLTAEGYIQNFETSATVLVEDSVTKYFDYHNKDLNGAVKLSWHAEKTAEGKEDPLKSELKLKLPTSFTIPLPLGDFPFSLEISESVIVAPAFSQVGDAARGSFKVTYTGTQGFSIEGGKTTFDGTTSGDAGIESYGAVSRLIPGTCIVAVALPKMELKPGFGAALEKIEEGVPSEVSDSIFKHLEEMAGEYLKENLKEDFKDAFQTTAAAFFSVAVSTSALSSGSAVLIPCQGAHLVVSAKVGAEMRLLGLRVLEAEKEIFSRKLNYAVPAVKGCMGG